mmetsp:Transcript_47088/g.106698  ORF Transcript_47088/g.106698 Transcript_47088/m.106698 type:complete len:233 (-) Transcript_47088:825-1523(-)
MGTTMPLLRSRTSCSISVLTGLRIGLAQPTLCATTTLISATRPSGLCTGWPSPGCSYTPTVGSNRYSTKNTSAFRRPCVTCWSASNTFTSGAPSTGKPSANMETRGRARWPPRQRCTSTSACRPRRSARASLPPRGCGSSSPTKWTAAPRLAPWCGWPPASWFRSPPLSSSGPTKWCPSPRGSSPRRAWASTRACSAPGPPSSAGSTRLPSERTSGGSFGPPPCSGSPFSSI